VDGKLFVKTPFSLEVLWLEPSGTGSPAAKIADRFTWHLREATRDYDGITLGTKNRTQLDAFIMAGCTTAQTACVARIATGLRVQRLIYGELLGPPWRLTLWLIVADTQLRVEWSIPSLPTTDAELRETAREALASLLSRSP
jgi:hypothetical protein